MSKHDKIATRLAQILSKLNNAESFSLDELVEEFGVTKRTIQRDINERLSYLPIKLHNGRYSLEEYYLGRLSLKDIQSFATLGGIKDLFPDLDDEFIKNILDDTVSKAYLIKGHHYEDISSKKSLFENIEKAILNKSIITFDYKDKKRTAKPYKLLNTKGIWYLVADEANKLKTFSFTKLENIQIIDDHFEQNIEYLKLIKNEDTNWFGENIEVILKVSSEVAHYFTRRKIFPNQEVIKRLEDGTNLISCKVAYDEEILRLVRYWIPHLEVVSPDDIKVKLENGLNAYLKNKI